MTIKKLFTFLFIFAVFGITGTQSSYAHDTGHNHKRTGFELSDRIASTRNNVVSHLAAFHKGQLAKTLKVKYKLINGKKV